MNNHFSKKKRARNCLLVNICKEKRKGIKIFRTQYKEARKSAVE